MSTARVAESRVLEGELGGYFGEHDIFAFVGGEDVVAVLGEMVLARTANACGSIAHVRITIEIIEETGDTCAT